MNKRSTGISLLIIIGYNVICLFHYHNQLSQPEGVTDMLGNIHGRNALVHANIAVKKEQWMIGASHSRKKSDKFTATKFYHPPQFHTSLGMKRKLTVYCPVG